eukprot:81871_1
MKQQLNNMQQMFEEKDEIKSNYNNNILTQYSGKFMETNTGKLLTVIDPFEIEQTKSVSTFSSRISNTAKMHAILPKYDANSNIIVYWKTKFIDNKKKNGFRYKSYFIGVISDTVSDMNNGPGIGMKDAYGILGKKGYVTRGKGI